MTPCISIHSFVFFSHVSDHHLQKGLALWEKQAKSEISRLVAQVQSDLRFKNGLLAASGDSSSTQLTVG